jgi:hypothetical protein
MYCQLRVALLLLGLLQVVHGKVVYQKWIRKLSPQLLGDIEVEEVLEVFRTERKPEKYEQNMKKLGKFIAKDDCATQGKLAGDGPYDCEVQGSKETTNRDPAPYKQQIKRPRQQFDPWGKRFYSNLNHNRKPVLTYRPNPGENTNADYDMLFPWVPFKPVAKPMPSSGKNPVDPWSHSVIPDTVQKLKPKDSKPANLKKPENIANPNSNQKPVNPWGYHVNQNSRPFTPQSSTNLRYNPYNPNYDPNRDTRPNKPQNPWNNLDNITPHLNHRRAGSRPHTPHRPANPWANPYNTNYDPNWGTKPNTPRNPWNNPDNPTLDRNQRPAGSRPETSQGPKNPWDNPYNSNSKTSTSKTAHSTKSC